MRNFILQLLLMSVLLPLTASSEQILPDDLHAMPVLIEIPLADKTHYSFGTGIYLNESNKLFLVTAAHCLFDVASTNRSELINSNAIISSLVGTKDSMDKNVFSLDLGRLSEEGRIKRHATHDVAVIYIASMTNPDTNGVILDIWCDAVQRISRGNTLTTCAAKDVCVLFTNILDGNETYVLGYPVELLNAQVPMEIDFNSPLIRKGVISQRNRQTGKLMIDSGVYGGNSGGPVLVVSHPSLGATKIQVAGLITQFVPVSTRVFPQAGVTNSVFVNSGYGVAEPIDYALELMRQF